MVDSDLVSEFQSNIDLEMKNCFSKHLAGFPYEFREILEYQMGWVGDFTVEHLRGKRFRPIVLLLASHALGGNWKAALPAALAIELIHNFSLIHDDIQDRSQTRRGREAVWVKWGEAQAINAGDAMLTLAHLSILSLRKSYNESVLLEVIKLIQETCLNLTHGQFIDIASENKLVFSRSDYLNMVGGKTGALIAASFGTGAILSGIDLGKVTSFIDFGKKLGLAYQIQDDWLGIWGEESITGKSTSSDLIGKKKTFPVILGFQLSEDFRNLWQKQNIFTSNEVALLSGYLTKAGIKEKTMDQFHTIYGEIVNDFQSLFGETSQSVDLKNLILGLFNRVN